MKTPKRHIVSSLPLLALGSVAFGSIVLSSVAACSSVPEFVAVDGQGGDGSTRNSSRSNLDIDANDSSSSGDGNGVNTVNVGQGGALFADDWDYPDDITFDYTAITGGGETCASVEGTPESVSRPIDIIFIIDNSSSMSNEIKEVEQNIKSNFADIIADSGIDYRVILISRYGDSSGGDVGGSDFQVCIPAPLGASACTDPQNETLTTASRFFHYSADIESQDALCVILESYDEPDEFDNQNTTNDGGVYNSWTALASAGWQGWLRQDAFKTFVVMTDDDLNCNTTKFSSYIADQNVDLSFNDNTNANGASVASVFDAALLALSPSQFGTALDRNYIWHSIIGLEENSPETTPWQPDDAIQTTTCDSGSSGVGYGYQHLSTLTGGLRYPICPTDDGSGTDVTNFDPIFDEIAQGVIETAAIPCEYDFPTVDGVINPANIKVKYTPTGGAETEFNRVDSLGDCTSGDDYYFDDNEDPTQLFLCGSACTLVQDDGGDLVLDFGCLGS